MAAGYSDFDFLVQIEEHTALGIGAPCMHPFTGHAGSANKPRHFHLAVGGAATTGSGAPSRRAAALYRGAMGESSVARSMIPACAWRAELNEHGFLIREDQSRG